MKIDAHETSVSYHVLFNQNELAGLIKGGFLSASDDLAIGRWLIWEELMAAAAVLKIGERELYRWKVAMVSSIESENDRHAFYGSLEELAVALSGGCTCGEVICIHKKMLSLIKDYKQISTK